MATEAAHAAGFHDSPHLTRTFKQLIGISPSDFAAIRDRVFLVEEDDVP